MIPNWRAARDVPIDILRGTGVIFMVFAYMGYFCFDFPHPYPVQFLGGFAPVIFLFLLTKPQSLDTDVAIELKNDLSSFDNDVKFFIGIGF